MTFKIICDTSSFISNALMVYLIIEFMHVTSDTSPTVPNVKAIGHLIMEIWHFITGGGGGNVTNLVT